MTTQRLRSALVTGSSGGLGLAVAESLAAAGFNIILHGLEETAARATGHGGAGSAPRHRCRIRYRPRKPHASFLGTYLPITHLYLCSVHS